VDVLISAPNLTRLPIHQIAAQQGICLWIKTSWNA
jgi:hypothetical protein